MQRFALALLALCLVTPLAGAQPQPQGFADVFPPAEYAARRAKVMDKLGDGVAVIQGSAEWPGYVAFRQNAQFFYLTGVEVPRAVLLIDGKSKQSTLFLPSSYRLANSEGPMLVAGDTARIVTGVEQVLPRDSMIAVLDRLGRGGRKFSAPYRGESRNAGAREQSTGFDRENALDPLDGRPSRERVLIDKLQAFGGGREVLDLDPTIDALRMIKSPAEIRVIRESTRIAQAGLAAAMRAAQPGVYEYQLAAAASFEFKNAGSQGEAYFPLVATGANAAWPHYHGNSAKLGANDLVLVDYAPDYKYYQSDVTRQFPVNGVYTARQREMYTIYLRIYQTVESAMRPGMAPKDVIKNALVQMDSIMAHFTFTDAKVKAAAERMVASYRTRQAASLGHMIGLETHDAAVPYDVLQPGMVFSLEPALTIPDEHVYIRIESVYLVTPTNVENLSATLPVEPAAIERLMKDRKPKGPVP